MMRMMRMTKTRKIDGYYPYWLQEGGHVRGRVIERTGGYVFVRSSLDAGWFREAPG